MFASLFGISAYTRSFECGALIAIDLFQRIASLFRALSMAPRGSVSYVRQERQQGKKQLVFSSAIGAEGEPPT
jgi:hypothetical protein